MGASPETLRVRTTSSSSNGTNGSLSPIKSNYKRAVHTSSEEEDIESQNMPIKSSSTNITSVFASMEFKSAKKSYSRLPNLSKKPRMSLEEPNDVKVIATTTIEPANFSTPVRVLPGDVCGSSTPLTGLELFLTAILHRGLRNDFFLSGYILFSVFFFYFLVPFVFGL